MRKIWLVLLNAVVVSFLMYSNCAFSSLKDVRTLTIIDSKAYVINAYQNFEILDISNLDNITTIGNIALDNPRDVTVVGNYAYVTDGGLCIVNISNPSNPYIEGRLTDTIGSTYRIDVVGNYAYTADVATIKSGKVAGLTVYDISNKSSPVVIGHINTDNATGVKVVGNYAYVADEMGGFKIIDITNPQNPVLVSSTATNCAVKVDVVGNYAYIADDTGGLKIFDIANPKSPILMGSIVIGNARAVKVAGNYAYVADYTTGLKVIDVSDPENPLLVSETISTLAQGISLFNSYVYMATGLAGIEAIKTDITRIEKSSNQNKAIIFYPSDFNKIFDGALTKIKITTLSKHGALKLSGNAVNVNQEIVATDLDKLIFIPESGWCGKTNFLLSVTNTDTYAENQAIISITIVNNPPVVSSISILGTEDTVISFSTTDFVAKFSDADGDNLVKIQIVSLPSHGTLKLSGTAVAVNQEIIVGSLGNLTFEPDLNWNGSDSFNWNGSDGTRYAAIVVNVNITIGAVNDPPTINSVSKSGTKDMEITFVSTDFTSKFSDADGDNLVKIQIVSLPSHGTLKLSGTAVTLNQEITSADLANLTYIPNTGWKGADGFSWNGSDGTGYAASGANVNITIGAVNGSPTINSVSKSGTKDMEITFVSTDFTSKFSDADGDNLVKIQIVSLPSHGTLKLSGTAVTLNQEITSADLANLTYIPNIDWIGADSFSWNGSDGMLYATNVAIVNITIKAANNLPTISPILKSGIKNTPLVFSMADFTSHFSDIDGDVLAKIQIASLPSNGALKLSEVPVTVNQEIVIGDLGNLTYVSKDNWSGNDSFNWNGSDGTAYAIIAANVNITIAQSEKTCNGWCVEEWRPWVTASGGVVAVAISIVIYCLCKHHHIGGRYIDTQIPANIIEVGQT
ncbi:hypothetical protein GAMM_90012 [Gammaproteobacteria bacterium]